MGLPDLRNAFPSMHMREASANAKARSGKVHQGSVNSFRKPDLTMPSIESAYLNLNLYANTNPNFQRNVIEKMMAISKKDAKFVSDDESILVKSVLNSFEVFGKFPAKMRDIISRDVTCEKLLDFLGYRMVRPNTDSRTQALEKTNRSSLPDL